MTTYICKCGRRVKKSTDASTTGNRLSGYAPGHECWGCPYAMPWGGNKWDEAAKRFVQDIKGYECRTSRTLSYDSHFIGSTKDKCTCSVVSLDFDFLEQISAWVKDTFPLGELTGGFSRDKIRPTDYSHNGRYCCTFVCTSNKKGIAAKAALFARFFNPDGSRKEKLGLADLRAIDAEVAAAQKKADSMTAWRIEGTLREFASFAPVNLWFDYPVHKPDSGLLEDLQPDSDFRTLGAKGASRRWGDKSKQAKDKKAELDTAFEACMMDGEVTVYSLGEYMDLKPRTVKNRLKEDGRFWIDGEKVGRKEPGSRG